MGSRATSTLLYLLGVCSCMALSLPLSVRTVPEFIFPLLNRPKDIATHTGIHDKYSREVAHPDVFDIGGH